MAANQIIDINQSALQNEAQGATAVVTHHINKSYLEKYELWLNEIGPLCKRSSGFLDLQIIRPIKDITITYTVIIRFDSHDHLKAWMCSDTRKMLIDKVRPMLIKDDDFFINSGLDFWFTPQEAKAKIPVRWKQFLVTWSAIYPLVLFTPMAVIPSLEYLGMPPNKYLDSLIITGFIVSLMIYLIMPRYTKLIHRWLFS
jgi:uncharacterized protein